MKKISIILAVLAFTTSGIWLYNDKISYDLQQIMQYTVFLIMVGYSVFMAISRYKSERRGEPDEDELSKKIRLKASSVSYYVSIIMWAAVSYFSDKSELAKDTLIVAGILGMAIIFFASWLYFKLRGIRDA